MLDPTTVTISVGSLTLTVERGFALWRGFKHKGISRGELTDALDEVKGDVRDALSTAQLQGGLERRDLEKALVGAINDLGDTLTEKLDDVRQEVTQAIRERRR